MSKSQERLEIRLNWTAEELRQLRYRLGWSRAELARGLGCEVDQISAWEASESSPDSTHRNRLQLYLHQAEMVAENVQRRPVAEVIMNDRGLAQIHENDVIDSLIDAPKKPAPRS